MVAVVLFLALIACAFSGCAEESPVETKSAPAPMPAPMPPTMTKQGDTAISVGGGTADYQYVDTNTEQKIIQRASLSIEVVDFQASSNALILIVERSDGFVSDSYSYVTGTGYKRGDFTIRVPTDEFLSVISEIEQIGNVKSKHTSGQDVTEEYIDLKARINNLERQEQRLLEILDMANTTQEVLVVEKEIWRVRSEIEQLTGRINYLENRIELATISVSLYEQEPITHSWGIRDAFRAAFEAFVSTIRGLIILVGYVVPILILVGLGWLIKSKLMPKLRKGKEGKVKE
ncbi:MAG: DUF4349 domain-containing protein, partial [Methanocellales archaeon]|nr:DUF4349 domain-containing protein [Methanocellales archaeon]MDD5447400.1 DUF4349 domain-containing protein [Methanocellales archaeon]